MKPRLLLLTALPLALVLHAGCGRKPAAPEPSGEVDLLVDALTTVNERYVDPEAAPVDLLISNSILGMARAIDPHAELLPADDPSLINTAPPPGVPLVEYALNEEDRVLTLRIYAFDAAARKQLRDLEPALRATRPSGIILDARRAYGQDYAVAADLAEWFLAPDFVVGTVIDRRDAAPRIFTTSRAPLWRDEPVIMLIDRETKGPEEWLAAALRYHERALLAGESSRGLALRQEALPVQTNWALRLTTGRALNPDGQPINGRPLTPDVPVALDPDDRENVDWIHYAATQKLKEKP